MKSISKRAQQSVCLPSHLKIADLHAILETQSQGIEGSLRIILISENILRILLSQRISLLMKAWRKGEIISKMIFLIRISSHVICQNVNLILLSLIKFYFEYLKNKQSYIAKIYFWDLVQLRFINLH